MNSFFQDQHHSNLETSVRVQLLRLLINFCDRKSAYKKLLMTPDELRQVAHGYFELTPNPGLVSKLILLITTGQGNSISTSWMCAALEAFLRGSVPRVHWWMTQSGLTRVCQLHNENRPFLMISHSFFMFPAPCEIGCSRVFTANLRPSQRNHQVGTASSYLFGGCSEHNRFRSVFKFVFDIL